MKASRTLLIMTGLLMPLVAIAQDEEADDVKQNSRGAGFSYSSGQSLFLTREIQPFRTNHSYYTLGVHIEEEGVAMTFSDGWGNYYRTKTPQTYYLEFGRGWRKLWLQDKMAAGFLPHTIIEGGISGRFVEFGRLRDYFQQMHLQWAPYVQTGVGISVFTGSVFYRMELGYVTTLSGLTVEGFPDYSGAYLKMTFSSGQKTH